MRKNRKVNNTKLKLALWGDLGKGGCLSMLLLSFLLVNPSVNAQANALDGAAENVEDNANDVADDDIASLAAGTSSTVGITFNFSSPYNISTSLSPSTSAGQSGRIDLRVRVDVQQSGGYEVYLKSDNPNLVGQKDSSNVILGTTTATTYDNMETNTWGYASKADADTVASDALYKTVSTVGNGDKVAENTSDNIITDTKTIALSFATKVDTEIPADTYSNTMLLSVVSSPLVITLTKINDMQEMTTEICENTATPLASDTNVPTKQLRDTRDGKYYWVSKLADGKCWMTQNLALDLSTSLSTNKTDIANRKTLTNADTDLNSKTSWTPTYPTFSTATVDTVIADDASTASWNLGSYYIKTPNGTTSCGYPKNKLSDCTSYFTQMDAPMRADNSTNAHYLTGNYYQWCATTAGCTGKDSDGNTVSGANLISGEALDSICPKGWRLPTSTSTNEFQVLITAGGIGSDVSKLTSYPYYFVRGGYVDQDTSFLLNNAGLGGNYWWSSTANNNHSYYLHFYGTSDIYPSGSPRRNGFSVRCIAR